MGLTTQYHKYNAAGIFSLVGSNKCNVVWIEYGGQKGKYCAAGACENIIIWDTKTGETVATLPGERHEVVRLAASPTGKHLAAGYHNGDVKIFDIKSGECLVTFSGHKSAVSCLAFDKQGMLLASGSRDTDIVIWDIVSQSGFYRLKGHKGLVTQLVFMKSQNILISSSKDTFIKFWDLDTQHCFRTLLTHETEVYGVQVNSTETRLYTGSADSEIRVYSLSPVSKDSNETSSDLPTKKKKAKLEDDVSDAESTASADEEQLNVEERLLSCQFLGSMSRQGKGRTVSLQIDSTGRSIACHGLDKTVEAFQILTDEERAQLLKKRASKLRKRLRAAGEDDSISQAEKLQLSVEDEHRRHEPIRLPAKPSSLDTICSSAGVCQVVAVLTNNSVYSALVDLSEKKSEVSKVRHLATAGHRTDVRALTFSNDGSALASASGEQLKIWNRDSLRCIRTMRCGYALCCSFLPGDRHVVVGTKSGTLQLFDLASSSMLEEIEAHEGALWSLCVLPDKRGIVTGSADQKVKFWQFELVEMDENDDEEEPKATGKRLTLHATRVLQMSDDVLCVKVSADNKLLAVSLLDNTIKVFFCDTLKFFLSLYGHSLPALCIDISTDGTLLISGSADKNIKVWGLDFGDCHKSIFAHDDSVMGMTFLPKTHMFFSCGKDGAVKQWDADTFNHITTLSPAHHGEVWAVVSSPSGMTLASSSHDKSIRLWEKCEEILVLEEEKEQQREREYDMEIEQQDNPVLPGETNEEIGFAGKKTVESVKSTERIMEAVDLWRTETHKPITTDDDLHPLLRAYKCASPVDYVLEVLQKVKPSELEESLLVMPFDHAADLLKVLDLLIRQKRSVELVTKCCLFLMRIHHNQITSNQMLLATIDKLKGSSTAIADEYKDRIGFNLCALQILQLRLESKHSEHLFADATDLFKKKEKRRKHKHKGPQMV